MAWLGPMALAVRGNGTGGSDGNDNDRGDTMSSNNSIHEMYTTSSPFRGATRTAALDIKTSAVYRLQMGLGPRLSTPTLQEVA